MKQLLAPIFAAAFFTSCASSTFQPVAVKTSGLPASCCSSLYENATCSPSGTCTACRNCSSCKNCSARGGSCSVCR